MPTPRVYASVCLSLRQRQSANVGTRLARGTTGRGFNSSGVNDMRQSMMLVGVKSWVFSRTTHYDVGRDEYAVSKVLVFRCYMNRDEDEGFYINGTEFRESVSIKVRVEEPIVQKQPIEIETL